MLYDLINITRRSDYKLKMPKMQLRSKRKTASPIETNGESELITASNKKPRKKKSSDLSDSESSSDEFVRPPDDMKVNLVGLSRRNGPSPEPNFSAIEKNIFSGMSQLTDSDSDSDDSDLQEVMETAPAVSNPCINVREVSKKQSETKPTSSGTMVEESSSAKSVRNTRLKLGKAVRSEKAVIAEERKSTTSSENKRTVTRASKRKIPEELAISSKLVLGKPKGDEFIEKKEMSGKAENSVSTKVKKLDKKQTKTTEPKASCGESSRSIKSKEKGEMLPVKNKVPETLDNLDIAQLLALGEGLKMETKSSEHSNSDSEEWEEVDPNDVKKHEIPKEGVQITLAAPEFSWRRKKQKDQQACLQAEMNRAFNRVRRELQLLCHKTSLLLWLAHGIFLNQVINSDNVKAMALSLIPSDLIKLPKAPGKKYVDLLLKWFAKEFECSEGFPDIVDQTKPCPLSAVLEQHFSRRYAKSSRELTFMFVTVLRAVGMESRLIISFQPMPLKPQSDELLSIKGNGAKSKRGRTPKNASKEDSDSEDDPDPEKKSKYFQTGKQATLVSQNKRKDDALPKAGRKSAPASVESVTQKKDKTRNASKHDQKSELTVLKSPSKTRELRKNTSKKKYKEVSNSDTEDSNESKHSKPILSPVRKKIDDKTLSERLKAAAAKRLPANKRRSDPGKVLKPGSSSTKNNVSQNSDSEFEPEPASQSGSNKKSASVQKPSTSRRSRTQEEDSDSDFEATTKPKNRSLEVKSRTPTKSRQSKGGSRKGKGLGIKVLSSDDDAAKKQLTISGSDYWVEVYLKDEERWTCVDVLCKKVDSTKNVMTKATQPISYVMAFNVEGTVKDVTKRYAPRFSQVTSKQRVSVEWLDKTLKPFKPKQSKREAAEDSEMNLVELDRPMPKSVGECKNHPLYVLQRHLLQFEAIYPPDSPSLGFVRGEPLYARQNVYVLRSRETWMREARVVKLGEEPYKILKRPKWDRATAKVIPNVPLEVFGPWQTEVYVPPPAKDGQVPRNAYGNVELFKPSMLPKGTVHLQVPGLNKVAKKLRIDCAPAVVGFDFHKRGVCPSYDGFVVCEEFAEKLLDAWNKEIDESAKRREEKHEKRIYGNWRRLIRGLLIREALKYRYDFQGEGQDEPGGSQSFVNRDVLKASRISTDDAPLPSFFPKLMANIRSQKSRGRKPSVQEKKSQNKSKMQAKKSNTTKKRKDESSEEEESEWDSSTTEEDESKMVLLSDEDSGSEFEDLKKK